MVIMTAKVPKRRLLLIVLLLIAAAVVLALCLRGAGGETEKPAKTGTQGATNEARIAFLESYGWQVSADPLSVEELAIPEEFDETYTQYLSLQSGQGFDLEKYKGKRVKRYTYEISNYPTGETGVQAGLLIYKNTVVGGEVLSSQLGGFIHGLAMPG